jgi:hypothetical protein
MFAPCLLGCRGTMRQCPVSGGSEMAGVPAKRHRQAFGPADSKSAIVGLIPPGVAHALQEGNLPL